MVVDDEYMNIEVMRMMLEEQGYSLEGATRGTDAIDMIKKRFWQAKERKAPMYKIIFLDYSMPEMDGPMVARAIRAFF